jgi:hypothetical protein
MSRLLCKCVDDIFEKYDYNNIPIKSNIFLLHNNKENAWISIDKEVYSIRKDDYYLLELFKNYYGKNVKLFLKKFIKNPKDIILILDKLKDRKIGNLTD